MSSVEPTVVRMPEESDTDDDANIEDMLALANEIVEQEPEEEFEVEEPVIVKKRGRPSAASSRVGTPGKSATPAPKTVGKTPRGRTPRAAVPAAASASTKRKAEEPVEVPAAKRVAKTITTGGRMSAPKSALAAKESLQSTKRGPAKKAAPAKATGGKRGRPAKDSAAAAAAPETDEDVYEVEDIIDSGIDEDGTHMYHVKWQGYPESENTWEPKLNLKHASELVKAFEKRAKAAAKKTRVSRGDKKKT